MSQFGIEEAGPNLSVVWNRTPVDLDHHERIWPGDRQDFLGSILAKAEMVRHGYRVGRNAAPDLRKTKGLLFAGMGASGIGANLVEDACTRVLDVPFTIVKHYDFPNHVKPDWHCLAVSYSGATEETLQVAREARRRNVPTTGFTVGGPLTDEVDNVVFQEAGHQPRASMAHAWFSLLGFLEGGQLLHAKVPVEEAARAVQEVDAACGPYVPEAQNEAKQLARILHEKIPQIYATPAFYGVGLFFRAQLNENAKKIADVDLVPECNHNDFTGWSGDSNRDHFTVMALSQSNQNPEIQKRLQWMRERYRSWGVPWHHHQSGPIETFEQHVVEQARAIQFLDYTAFYTAMLRRVDPSEIKEIIALKEYLRREPIYEFDINAGSASWITTPPAAQHGPRQRL